jgi:hypothetical protein
MRISPFRLAAIAGSRPLAGLQFVGAASASSNSDATPALSLTSLTGGIGNAAMAGDLVIGVIANTTQGGANIDLEATCDGTWSDCTERADLFSDDNSESQLGVFVKIMGATPDASIEFRTVSAAGTRGTAIAALVFRRASSTVAIATSTGVDSYRANPPTITPTVSGSLVIAVGAAGCGDTRLAVPAFSGYTTLIGIIGTGSFNNAKLVVASAPWASGAVDPPEWTDADDDSTTAAWCAATLVVTPS